MRRILLGFILVKTVIAGLFLAGLANAQTEFQLEFIDADSQDPVSCRLEFIQPTRRYPLPRRSLVQGSQVLAEGVTHWTPRPGVYEFWVARGSEFEKVHAGFTIEQRAKDSQQIAIKRKTPMRKEGWYSGDLLSFLPAKDLIRWQAADDLDLVVSTLPILESDGITTSKTESKKVDPSIPTTLGEVVSGSYLDDRLGSGLLMHRWQPPAQVPAEVPSSQLLVMAKENPDVHVEIQTLWARDVPIWLASGRIDSVQLLSSHLRPESSDTFAPNIRNPDSIRFAGPRGLARLAEHIYWQALDTGLRLPPTAGTGFGSTAPSMAATYLGYNRVYVRLENNPTAAAWWLALKSGNTFVSNGPLLRANVNGQTPGHVFSAETGQAIDLDIDIQVTVRDPVDYLDVVFNGKALYQARLEDHARRGRFPPMSIKESGWLLIRIVTAHDSSYRMASTAPFYFEFDQKPRINRQAVRFFTDWLEDTAKQIETEELKPELHQRFIQAAQRYWQKRSEQFTVDQP